jgi:hypothetical protein
MNLENLKYIHVHKFNTEHNYMANIIKNKSRHMIKLENRKYTFISSILNIIM